MSRTQFVGSVTRLAPVPFAPEISLHMAGDIYEVWQRTESQAGRTGLAPPFWSVAWPGGQALARYLLDHPALVRGRSVLDLGCGSGLVAIAAAKAGAAAVTASDTDPFARAAAELNAAANGVVVSVDGDVLGRAVTASVVLAGDLWYEQDLAGLILRYLGRAVTAGAEVLTGDIGRRYFPRQRFHRIASYQVPVSAALENADVLRASVWALREFAAEPASHSAAGGARAGDTTGFRQGVASGVRRVTRP